MLPLMKYSTATVIAKFNKDKGNKILQPKFIN